MNFAFYECGFTSYVMWFLFMIDFEQNIGFAFSKTVIDFLFLSKQNMQHFELFMKGWIFYLYKIYANIYVKHVLKMQNLFLILFHIFCNEVGWEIRFS